MAISYSLYDKKEDPFYSFKHKNYYNTYTPKLVTNTQGGRMITHVQVDDFPFKVKVSSTTATEALNQAQSRLREISGRSEWKLVPVGDVSYTEESAVLSAKTVSFTDANGNVHASDKNGKLVPLNQLS